MAVQRAARPENLPRRSTRRRFVQFAPSEALAEDGKSPAGRVIREQFGSVQSESAQHIADL
jgi:hypothetical protein